MAKWYEKDETDFQRDRKRDKFGAKQQRREQRLAARQGRDELLDPRMDEVDA